MPAFAGMTGMAVCSPTKSGQREGVESKTGNTNDLRRHPGECRDPGVSTVSWMPAGACPGEGRGRHDGDGVDGTAVFSYPFGHELRYRVPSPSGRRTGRGGRMHNRMIVLSPHPVPPGSGVLFRFRQLPLHCSGFARPWAHTFSFPGVLLHGEGVPGELSLSAGQR